jgi:hypothetical protein
MKDLDKFVKWMGNNKLLLILLAGVVLMAGSPMSMLTGSHTVTASPGEVLSIPVSFENDYSFFGSSAQFRVLQDTQGFGPSDKTLWKDIVTLGSTKSFTASYTVPTTPGTYNIDYDLEAYTGRWTGCGSFRLTVEVVEPADEPGAGDVVEDSTISDIEEKVGPVVLNGSIFDKIALIFNLLLAWIGV